MRQNRIVCSLTVFWTNKSARIHDHGSPLNWTKPANTCVRRISLPVHDAASSVVNLHAARRGAVRIIPKFVGSISSSAAGRLAASLLKFDLAARLLWLGWQPYVYCGYLQVGIQRWPAGQLQVCMLPSALPSRMPTPHRHGQQIICVGLDIGSNTNVQVNCADATACICSHSSEKDYRPVRTKSNKNFILS